MAEPLPIPELYLTTSAVNKEGGDHIAFVLGEEQEEFAEVGLGLAKNKLGQDC